MSMRSHVTRLVCTCASASFDRFVALGDRFHGQHCRRSSPASSCQFIVKTGLLQRRSRRPAQLRPGPCAVRHQRCRMPDSWRAAPRPHHSAPCRPPLAEHTTAHPVQAVRTELLAERHLPGRECGITASPALRVIGRSHRAGDATYKNGRPRLRRRKMNKMALDLCMLYEYLECRFGLTLLYGSNKFKG